MGAPDLLFLVLLGGAVGLDGAALAQIMVSRPLVSAGMAGLVLHEPVLGLGVGLVMEIFFLPVFPVGGGRFPEGGPAGVVGAGAALQAGAGAPGLAFGVLAGLAVAQIGGYTVAFLRQLNGRLIPDPGRDRMTPARIVASHLGAILLDFFRGCLLVGAALGVVLIVGDRAGRSWPLSPEATEGLLLVGAAVSLGALFQALGGWRRRRLFFLVGLAAGLTAVGLLA